MRRINTANTIDLAAGKKGFRGKNTAAGVPGTPLHEDWLNDIQEEIANVIEGFGTPLGAARDQMFSVLRQRMTFVPVLGVTSAIPGAPAAGDMYLVASAPAPAGAWAGQADRIAIFNGAAWVFITLPIGSRVVDTSKSDASFQMYLRRTAGGWVSASASQTAQGMTTKPGATAAAGGTADAITCASDAIPDLPSTGYILTLTGLATNTVTGVTLRPNGGTIRNVLRSDGTALAVGDLGGTQVLEFDGASWRLISVDTRLRTERNNLISATGRTPLLSSQVQIIEALRDSRLIYMAPSGAANAIVMTPLHGAPAIDQYKAGQIFTFQAPWAAVGGGTTINFGPGVKTVNVSGYAPVPAGAWKQYDMVSVIYDAAQFHLFAVSAQPVTAPAIVTLLGSRAALCEFSATADQVLTINVYNYVTYANVDTAPGSWGTWNGSNALTINEAGFYSAEHSAIADVFTPSAPPSYNLPTAFVEKDGSYARVPIDSVAAYDGRNNTTIEWNRAGILPTQYLPAGTVLRARWAWAGPAGATSKLKSRYFRVIRLF